MKNILTIGLCLFCLNLFSQNSAVINGLSLQLVQVESYDDNSLGFKPIIDLGIGYERKMFQKVGMFASVSIKKGDYDEKSERWETEGTVREMNMKLGIYRRIDFAKQVGIMVKLNAFHENSKIDNYRLIHEGGSELVAEFYNRKYLGFEIGLQPELKLTEKFNFFFVTSYQIGRINRYSDAWELDPHYPRNFNLFESIGINYRW